MKQYKKVDVYLDGVLQQHVVTADEDNRWLLKLSVNEEGKLYINHYTQTIAAEEAHGDVRIHYHDLR